MSIDGIGDLKGTGRVAGTGAARKHIEVHRPSGLQEDSYHFSEESRISLLREKVKTLAKGTVDIEDRTQLIHDLKQKINDPIYNETALRELAARIAENSDL
ncbi:MAG: hypothetical protein LBC99_05190 [Spirochaetota bacterium]|nr:hypothetical protein [Spirochaetota bacterium]